MYAFNSVRLSFNIGDFGKLAVGHKRFSKLVVQHVLPSRRKSAWRTYETLDCICSAYEFVMLHYGGGNSE
jgi:hypothetical protein